MEENNLRTAKMAKIWVLFFCGTLIATSLVLYTLDLLLGLIQISSVDGTQSTLQLGFFTYFIITILVNVVIGVIAVIKGWTRVDEHYEYIVEVLGRYIGKPLVSDIYIMFPWLDLVIIRASHFKGEQEMQLYSSDSQQNSIEFQNSSAPIEAFLYFEVADSAKATYNIFNVLKGIEELTDFLLRSFFGMYTIDQAIKLKSKCNIWAVACMVDFNKDPDKVVTIEDFEKSDFYKSLVNWGIKAIKLSISDIILPPEVDAARLEVLKAEQDVQVADAKKRQAVIDNERLIINAKAAKEVTEIAGEAEGNRIAKIVEKSGLSNENAMQYFITVNKWATIGKMTDKPNFTLIEGEGAASSTGAALGVGIGAGMNKKETITKKGE